MALNSYSVGTSGAPKKKAAPTGTAPKPRTPPTGFGRSVDPQSQQWKDHQSRMAEQSFQPTPQPPQGMFPQNMMGRTLPGGQGLSDTGAQIPGQVSGDTWFGNQAGAAGENIAQTGQAIYDAFGNLVQPSLDNLNAGFKDFNKDMYYDPAMQDLKYLQGGMNNIQQGQIDKIQQNIAGNYGDAGAQNNFKRNQAATAGMDPNAQANFDAGQLGGPTGSFTGGVNTSIGVGSQPGYNAQAGALGYGDVQSNVFGAGNDPTSGMAGFGQGSAVGGHYSGQETGAMGTLVGQQGLTGAEQFGNIQGMMGKMRDPNALEGTLESNLQGALQGKLTPGSQDVFDAREALMQKEEADSRESMTQGLGANRQLWGSARLDAEREMGENMAMNRQALMADLQQQDSQNAMNYVLQDKGFQNQLIGTMAGIEQGATGQAGQAASGILDYTNKMASQALNQVNAKQNQMQMQFNEKQANVQNQIGLMDRKMREAETQLQSAQNQQKLELDAMIQNQAAQLQAAGMDQNLAIQQASNSIEVQQMQAQFNQQNKQNEIGIQNMSNEMSSIRNNLDLERQNLGMNIYNAGVDQSIAQIGQLFPQGVMPGGPMGGLGATPFDLGGAIGEGVGALVGSWVG